jgi:hypothetical protein
MNVRSGLVKCAAAFTAAALMCTSRGAHAQGPQAPAPPPAPAPSPAAAPSPESAAKDQSPATLKEAKERFERALTLYDDHDYDAALVEFHRAYDLAPSYKILYNIAKIERVQNKYSAALTNFQRYLELGGAEVPADRRDEVQKEVAVLKTRVAFLTIKTNVDGADVYIDDDPICSERAVASTCIGKTPLQAPVIVNPGRRKVSISKRGYITAASGVSVAGGDTVAVNLELVDIRPKAVDNGPRDRAIVSWVATGVLAAGAGTMGVLTLTKKNRYNDDLNLPPCANQTINSNSCLTDPSSTLSSDQSQVKTLALVTDILTGAAVVAAGISIYFTAKAVGHHDTEAPPAPAVGLRMGPGAAALIGSF